ncbi:MAG: alpha/beta hydrolase [Bacteroidia bacterium]|nr:alpha/beta hydrolase [Bacteroidia bacterium]
MKREKVTFENSRGTTLSGAIEFPENSTPKAFAIFSHCFTCNKNLINVKYISEALSEKRIAVLRFDFTGLGDSGGNFAETDFTSNLDDLESATRFLENNYEAPKLLVGHSLGGAASIVAADRIDSVKAISLLGTPSTLDHIKRLFVNKMDEISYNGSALIDVAGREVEIGKGFVDDLANYNIKKSLNKLNKPLLILHSPQDEMVNIEHATEIFMAARHPKSFIALDGIDHLIKNIKDARYVGSLIGEWAMRYL